MNPIKLSVILLITALVCAIIAIVFSVVALTKVYAQDVDPKYYCLMKDQYPYSQLCDKQEIDKIIDQLLERAQEWNRIYNNTDNNTDTQCIAPQISNCDPGPREDRNEPN